MAYFLKKTRLKGRTYLSIDESFYSHEKKGTVHKCYKSLGSIETWKEKGIFDPVSYFQKEVEELNREREDAGIQKISANSPAYYLGYFPLKAILDRLQIQKYMRKIKLETESDSALEDIYELLTSLIYAWAVYPIDRQTDFENVFSRLYNSVNYTYDQLMDALSFLGNHYEEIVWMFTDRVSHVYGLDTSKTYFGCSDFYFETDGEGVSSGKGQKFENKKETIIGIRVLHDSHMIPFDIKIYSRDESEKPVLEETYGQMKSENHIDGKTVRMAGNGYSSARNITYSRENGEGYLYMKSLRGLSKTEEAWALSEDGFTEVKDKEGKLLYRYKSCVDEFPYKAECGGEEYTVKMREKHVLIYDSSIASKKRYEIYRMVEKAKTLHTSGASRTAYGQAGKYIHSDLRKDNGSEDFINWEVVDRDLKYAGYTLFATSETEMDGTDIVHIHYDLRKIENIFEFMKYCMETNLLSMPGVEAIKGCFLVSYLTMLLERILQVKILNDEYSGDEIFRFIREFRVMKGETRYINVTKSTDFIQELAGRWKLPLMNYFLTETQIKAILKCRL